MSKRMLWPLFLVNLAGTVYGYEWYWEQMVDTIAHKPLWMVLYVPDSPTASLFFTLSLVYLLLRRRHRDTQQQGGKSRLRSIIETIGLVTSFKYGIWAVAVIAAGHAYGDPLTWQDWMLSTSHLGMAAEALLFARFFTVRPISVAVAAIWAFSNDWLDYRYEIFPWLPPVLMDKLGSIQAWTIVLSAVSLLVFLPFISGTGRSIPIKR